MKKKRRNAQGQRIFLIICLFFFVGIVIGSLLANFAGQQIQAEMVSFLTEQESVGQEAGFPEIFWKYMKYDFIIWVGGWMSMGLFLSGAAFLLRSISLGFASTMMMLTYGRGGILKAMIGILPVNLILIPGYLMMMCAAVYYMLSWQEEGRKRTLRREQQRKRMEYCIIFGISIALMVMGSGLELWMTHLSA